MKKRSLLTGVFLSVIASTFLLAEGDVIKLEDVTVSANKIEEKAKDVPQSITVLDEETLEEKRITQIEDVAKEVPNMSFQHSANGSESMSFRGLNTSTFAFNNPVVIYVDGVPYYDRYDYNPSLLNVQQIEVLRGPQGTLYGKDAIGGVINIITKEPTNEWHGSIGTEYGNYNFSQSTFNASGALIDDKLFAGVNGTLKFDDGWITNDYPGMNDDANRQKDQRLAGFLLFKPTDRFSGKLTLSHDHLKDYFMDAMAIDSTVALNDLRREDNEYVSFDVPQFRERTTDAQSLRLNYDFDFATLESITTHKDFSLDVQDDADYKSGTSMDGLKSLIVSHVKTWTEELRLSSKDQAVRWVSGIYLDDEKRNQGPYGNARSLTSVANVESEINTQTAAVFAQAVIPLYDKLDLTLGGRYQHVSRDIDSDYYNSFSGGTSLHHYADKKTWNTFLPKAALSYKFNDALMTYASVSKGYIPGGFNFYSSSDGSDSSFDSESSINYEAGIKYLGDDYSVNASVFRMNIEDLQVYKMVGYITVVDNAKKAHSQGVELDGKYLLTDHIELSAALGLIEAEYDDYTNANVRYDGQRIESTPRFTSNLGIAYIATRGWYGRADLQGRGTTGFIRNSRVETTDGGFTANARLGYKLKDWDIYGFVNNITDEAYILTYGRGVGFNDPRRFGVGVKYTF